MSTFLQDLRHGARIWARTPGPAAVAALTLALGIGANTAIFSVVDGVLLRPLPYRDPERLVLIWEANPGRGLPLMFASPPNLADWQARSEGFASIGAWSTADLTLLAGEEPERVRAARVSGSLFPLLGIAPEVGRVFLAEEDRPGAPRVVLLSHGLWERRFGGDPGMVGERLTLEGEIYTVIGVMPAGFHFPPPMSLEGNPPALPTELWLPLGIDYASGQRGAHHLTALGRLKPGVSLDEAQTEMSGIAAALEREYPETNQGWRIALVPLLDQVVGHLRPALLVLSAAVGMVLLIACANVANLLLARGVARQREMAIRTALGASKARLARQWVTESLVLALGGGVGGALLAFWGVRMLSLVGGADLPRLDEVSFDVRVLAFTSIVSLSSGIVFGAAPVLPLRALRLSEWLKEGDPRSGGRRAGWLRPGLVVAQISLALILLAGAGLLFRGFLALVSVDPGFEARHALAASTVLPRARYEAPQDRVRFVERALARIGSLPGVVSAASIDEMPLAGDRQGTSFAVEGEPAPEPGTEPGTNVAFVSPGYFRAMKIPLLRGRAFTDADREDARPVVVVNRAFAERYFPGRDPIGTRIVLGFETQTTREIVGVVGDERHRSIAEPAPPNAYGPYLQQPRSYRLTFVLRTSLEPESVAASLRAILREIDPSLPLFDVREVEEIVAASVAQPRFSALLLAVFAGVALVLAAVGIYGVMSYTVRQQIPDIGLRIALGASKRDILALVLGRGIALTLIGAAIGLAGAIALARFLEGVVYGAAAADVGTLAAVSAFLVAIALLACSVPARRAARVDPIAALRYE